MHLVYRMLKGFTLVKLDLAYGAALYDSQNLAPANIVIAGR